MLSYIDNYHAQMWLLLSKETKEVTSYLSTAGFLFNKVAGDTLRELEKNPELARLIEQYNNTFVRAGQMLPDSKKHTARSVSYTHLRAHET